MARMSIMFSGFADLAKKIDEVDSSALKPAVNKALTETGKFIQNNVNQATLPYTADSKGLKGYATGDMFKALKKDNPVIWKTPYVAEVSVGFNLNEKGGFHSIFVMYGTPRMAKDQKLYNSIKGTRTIHAVALLQEKILSEALYEVIKG